jgi:hypothetical protein
MCGGFCDVSSAKSVANSIIGGNKEELARCSKSYENSILSQYVVAGYKVNPMALNRQVVGSSPTWPNQFASEPESADSVCGFSHWR